MSRGSRYHRGQAEPIEEESMETQTETQPADMSEQNPIITQIQALLDQLNLTDLNEVIEDAHDRRRFKEQEARNLLLAEFRQRAEQMGFDIEDVFPGMTPSRRRATAGSTIAPKYRGPNGETWSGRGMTPRWMTTLEAEGHHKDEYKIPDTTEPQLPNTTR